MNILIAPNAYKDSLDAVTAARCIGEGLKKALPDAKLILHPVADGGDSTLEAVRNCIDIQLINTESRDPLNRTISACYGLFDDGAALIEMAGTSGIHLLTQEERRAGITDSFGTGILIRDAIDRGCRKIFLGVGGTATVDAGTGILRALGFRFTDQNGNDTPPGGFNLGNIANIHVPADIDHLKKTEIIILSDVTNPLLGPEGASYVFAPQKGASPQEVNELEQAMAMFATVVMKKTGMDISSLPYGGAAGGTPAGLMAFLTVFCQHGAETILSITNFSEHLEWADIVITGEGKLDSQTANGKAPMLVAQLARSKDKKVIFLGGQVPPTLEDQSANLFDAVFSISPGIITLGDALANTDEWLERTAWNIGRVLGMG